jgi:hypothetical protein
LKQSKGLESDLVFYIRNACIERTLKKINDLLDSRGERMTGFSGSISKTGFFSSVLFCSGLRTVFTAARTAVSSAEAFPLVGFCTGAVIFVILLRSCPRDFFWHLARRGFKKKFMPSETNGMKILSKRSGLIFPSKSE